MYVVDVILIRNVKISDLQLYRHISNALTFLLLQYPSTTFNNEINIKSVNDV